MKSNIRILTVGFLTAIYCFAIGVVATSHAYADFHANPISSNGRYIADFPAKLLCHTSQSESLVNTINSLPLPGFKNTVTGLWTIASATEQIIEAEFSQYNAFSRNILIRHRKADHIFPFHYFW